MIGAARKMEMSVVAEVIQGYSWERWYFVWASRNRWSSLDSDKWEVFLGTSKAKVQRK